MPASNQPATANAYDYLVRALQLLEKPRYSKPTNGELLAEHSWIRNAEAWSDSLQQHVAPEDERADAWCTIGAVKAVTKYDPDPEAAYRYCLSLLNAANPMYVAEGTSQAQPRLNDNGSWPLVRGFFQRAIAMAARLQSSRPPDPERPPELEAGRRHA